jgi:pimeloyl-ACP methyl ester carboxylesterase
LLGTPEELKKYAERVKNDPVALRLMQTLEPTMTLFGIYPESYEGMVNDMQYYQDPIPYELVKCPVHILHGDHDADINISNAERIHKGIPHSELKVMVGGGHMIW